MKVATRRMAGFGLALTMFAGVAAAMPPVMDRLPTDAAMVVVIPSVEQLEKDVKSVAQLVGQPLPVGAEALLSQMGITSGFNKGGSMVMVLNQIPDEDAPGEPDMLVLVPTGDYAGLLKSYDATPSGGIDEIEMPGGDKGFIKKLEGGYAVMAPKKSLVEKFSGSPGSEGKFKAMLGSRATTLTDSGDAFIVLNVDVARPQITKMINSAMENMGDQMEMMGGGGMNVKAFEYFSKMMVEESTAIVASINIDNVGVSFDIGANFKPGSRLAGVAVGGGKSGALLSKLPAQPYLFAMAMDTSNPGLKGIIEKMPKGEAADAMPGMDMQSLMKNSDGNSMIIGIPSGGLMGGLMTRTVTFSATKDTGAAVAEFKKTLSAMSEEKIAATKYETGAAEVEGVKVDAWEMKMSMGDEPQMAQVMMGLFGPAGGPTGYLATTDGGIIQTFSKSADLMASAMKAAKGEGSFAKDQLVSQIGAKLPEGRMFEGYIGVKGIIESVLPMAAMFMGTQVKFDMPAQVPPVAMGLAASEGGAVGSFYVPNQTIKTVADLVRAFEEAQNRGEEGDEEPEAKPAKKPGF